jgi:hypothetical protein
MYPRPELAHLAARKCALRARIRNQRASCAEAVLRATRPLQWLDELMALWRSLAPLVRILRASIWSWVVSEKFSKKTDHGKWFGDEA